MLFLMVVIGCLSIQSAQAQAPAAPTGLSGIPGRAHVNLYWTAPAGATGYNLYRGIGAGSTPVLYKSALTATSYADNSLTDGTTYQYYVTATNASGEGGASSTISATPNTAPAAPTGIAAMGGTSAIALSWNPVAGCTYNVYRDTSRTSPLMPLATGLTSPSYSDTSVTMGVGYFYWVSAVSGGEESTHAGGVNSLLIQAPSALTATVGSGSVGLSWTRGSQAWTYNLYRGAASGSETLIASGIQGVSTTDGNSSFVDTALTNGQTYYYKVQAVNGVPAVSDMSNEVSATPSATALASPKLTVTVVGTSNILTWTAVPGATQYQVGLSSNPGGPYSYTTATGTTFTSTPASQTSTYYYVVHAMASSAAGPNSNEVGACISLGNVAAGVADAYVSQSQPASNFGALSTLQVSAQSGAVCNSYLTFDISSAGGAISSAALQMYKSGATSGTETVYAVDPGSWTETGITWNNAPALTGTAIGSAAVGTATGYQSIDVTSYVRAQQLAGVQFVSFGVSTSATSALVAYAREAGYGSRPRLMMVAGAPLAPSNVTATGTRQQQIPLSWNAVSGATSYNIYRGTTSGGETQVKTGVTTTSYTDTGLANATTYYYQVTAVNANGESVKSAEASATTNAYPVMTVAAASPNPVLGTTVILSEAATDDGGAGNLTYTWITILTPPAPVTFGVANGTNTGSSLTATFTAPGTYTFQVTVADSLGLASGSAVNVTVNQTLTSIVVSPSSASVSVNGTQQFSATGKDQFGLPMASQPTFTWSVVGGGTVSASGLFTAGATAGTSTVTATNGAIHTSATVTVSGASVPAAPTGLTATGTQKQQIPLSWNAVSGATSYNIYRGTTSGAETQIKTGLTATTYTNTGLANGTTYYYQVTAVNANGEGARSAEASATTDAVPVITVAASASPVSGTTTSLSVTATDDGGAGNLTYTWITTGTPPASVTFGSANGTSSGNALSATFTASGSYSFQVTVADSLGLATTSAVNVTVNQTLTSIVVSPSSASVSMNGTQQFSATGKDQFGLPMASQPTFTWSVVGGGTVSASGLFTAGATAGTSTVTAASGGVSNSASVTVTNNAPPVVTSLTSADAVVGTAFNYQITATNSPTSFSATSLPAGLTINTATGAISGTPTTPGVVSATITASNASGNGSAVLTITITKPAGSGYICLP